ncbi:hypothetical protein DFH09DRAFT_1147734 [Mycena vulgaris]|nr:hypothetical protein DFH09DRAFT_1147734 [Mycena vulgaris]
MTLHPTIIIILNNAPTLAQTVGNHGAEPVGVNSNRYGPRNGNRVIPQPANHIDIAVLDPWHPNTSCNSEAVVLIQVSSPRKIRADKKRVCALIAKTRCRNQVGLKWMASMATGRIKASNGSWLDSIVGDPLS